MNGNCLEIGIIQAFLDGELPHNEIDRVSSHIAVCDNCACLLATAEEELAVVFPALEREMDSLVPTQRLWAKIDAEIKHKNSRPLFGGIWATLSSLFASPSFAAACGLLLVVAIGAFVVLNNRTTPVIQTVASNPTVSTPAVKSPTIVSNEPDTVLGPRPTMVAASQNDRPTAIKASYTAPRSAPTFRPMAASAEPLAGEESYVRTIATLSKDVDGQKDLVLRPSERNAYERDMAVVNDTITKMRKAVKKNPRNESAKQVLYSSYQNKIDLLNSVSQRGELFASVR